MELEVSDRHSTASLRDEESVGAAAAVPMEDAATWRATPDGRGLLEISDSVEDLFGFPVRRWFEPNFWIRQVYAADRYWVMEQLAAHRGSIEAFEMNYRVVDAEGRPVWVRESVWMEGGHAVRGTMWIGSREATLLEEVRTTKARLHEAMSRHFRLREHVARRLAAEIHDDLGQFLTVSIRDVELMRCELLGGEGRQPESVMARVDRVEFQLRQVLHRLRMMAATLRPPTFEEGFVAALEQHVRMVTEATGLAIDVDVDENAVPEDCEEIHLFRIVQESLSNIIRHSDASEVRITFAPHHRGSRLEIADNGRGFDPARVERGGVGLATIRERVELLGGRFTIESSPGRGTMLKAWFSSPNPEMDRPS